MDSNPWIQNSDVNQHVNAKPLQLRMKQLADTIAKHQGYELWLENNQHLVIVLRLICIKQAEKNRYEKGRYETHLLTARKILYKT